MVSPKYRVRESRSGFTRGSYNPDGVQRGVVFHTPLISNSATELLIEANHASWSLPPVWVGPWGAPCRRPAGNPARRTD